MRYRKLGETGLTVSEIGFGAWGIGGATSGPTSYGRTDDNASMASLEAARDQGINFFDTANVYGNGHSEQLIGRAFRNCRESVVIATKAGMRDYVSAPDFSVPALRQSVEGSLARLKTDYLDLLQLHNPTVHELKASMGAYHELDRLKKTGRVRAIGVSAKSPQDALALLREYPFEAVQVNFNMLDIRLLQSGLLERLLALRVGLIARTPLAFGFLGGSLTGDEHFAPDDHRSRWPREQLRLWAQGARDLFGCCDESGATPSSQIALRFCLSYAAVSTTIPGMLSVNEVAANAAASDAGVLSRRSRLRVEELHAVRKFVS